MKKLLTLSAVFAAAVLAGAVNAQPPAAQAPAQQAAPQIDVTPELKDKFVDAYVDIMQIQASYSEQLQSVTDEAEANSLQQQAQTEMQDAVVDNDLSIDEYNQIIQMASSDPELQQELQTAIEENS